jgi:hypothetical protein
MFYNKLWLNSPPSVILLYPPCPIHGMVSTGIILIPSPYSSPPQWYLLCRQNLFSLPVVCFCKKNGKFSLFKIGIQMFHYDISTYICIISHIGLPSPVLFLSTLVPFLYWFQQAYKLYIHSCKTCTSTIFASLISYISLPLSYVTSP